MHPEPTRSPDASQDIHEVLASAEGTREAFALIELDAIPGRGAAGADLDRAVALIREHFPNSFQRRDGRFAPVGGPLFRHTDPERVAREGSCHAELSARGGSCHPGLVEG
jgi:hypothetical protein